MSEPKLKPCPFCGGEAHVVNRPRRYGSGWQGWCLGCQATTSLRSRDAKEAADAWNRRTEPARGGEGE